MAAITSQEGGGGWSRPPGGPSCVVYMGRLFLFTYWWGCHVVVVCVPDVVGRAMCARRCRGWVGVQVAGVCVWVVLFLRVACGQLWRGVVEIWGVSACHFGIAICDGVGMIGSGG